MKKIKRTKKQYCRQSERLAEHLLSSVLSDLANLTHPAGALTDDLKKAMLPWLTGEAALPFLAAHIDNVLNNPPDSGWSLVFGSVNAGGMRGLVFWSENEKTGTVQLANGEVRVDYPCIIRLDEAGKVSSMIMPLEGCTPLPFGCIMQTYDWNMAYEDSDAAHVVRVPHDFLEVLIQHHGRDVWAEKVLSIYQRKVAEWEIAGGEPKFRVTLDMDLAA
ncbi:MAG: hypothetical protein ACYC69_02575 [Thermodesulfovibrionales bacterium]